MTAIATIILLLASWGAVSLAMLWGVLRVLRWHHVRISQSALPAPPTGARVASARTL